jgi:carboxypeptidase D
MQAFVFLRDFILGNNTTGLVDGSNVVGGEDPTLMGAYLPADTAAIFYGSGSTVASTVAPSETIAAWRSFIATAVTAVPQSSGAPTGSNSAEGLENSKWISGIATLASIMVSVIL